ncbi:DNA-binding MarR family transcriptional regulator [Solirubrobacter pauli]|uniref:DNA-binding MarR family transcriptional regulator n=1 Tax=Solirubrobacter pauli TaxID=166793 RepID=A0A660L7D4_9ACTN|nr:MarR family transcriptional regulator [Solirubrobacter pauli]RKQ87853.1 DNA-binding MarR family transcriptional regulator [Solirubrobacter pauli]
MSSRRYIALLYISAIEDLAAQLERRVALVTQLLRAHAPRGRSVGALLTLRRLDAEGPQRVTDLAAAELVTQPTMTVLVNRLEQDGLVRKTRDAEDARAVLVEITEVGRAQLTEVRAGRAAVLQERLDRLDDEARAALAAALPALDQLLDV